MHETHRHYLLTKYNGAVGLRIHHTPSVQRVCAMPTPNNPPPSVLMDKQGCNTN